MTIFAHLFMTKTTLKNKWKKWAKILATVYILGAIAIYTLQDLVMFRPVQVKRNEKYNFTEPYREINIPINRETTLNLIQFITNDSLPRGVVLYLHGNKRNIARYAEYAPYFTKHGYEVWMIDYPGFGKSTGDFSEQKLYECAEQLYKLAHRRFSADSIIIYGKSLGTGIAAQLASLHNCRQLILETPYYDIPSTVRRYLFIYPVDWLIHYKIPTWQYLQKVEVPVTIFHGTLDGIIAYRNAARLKGVLKQKDEFITIENGSHNDLYNFPETIQKLDSLLR
jgi:pimeloyl-ACP methyl ester carboxylesterase